MEIFHGYTIIMPCSHIKVLSKKEMKEGSYFSLSSRVVVCYDVARVLT